MNELIPEPVSGADILPWARGVTDVCRRFAGVGSSGLLVREGPGGIGYEAIQENKRSKRKSNITPGCFAIGLYTPDYEGAQPYLAVMNRFYRIGHLFKELTAATPPAIDDLVSAESPILALVVTADVAEPEASLESFEDFAALASEGEDESKAIYPLYLCRFNDDEEYAGVEIDFRNMPDIDMTEG